MNNEHFLALTRTVAFDLRRSKQSKVLWVTRQWCRTGGLSP